MDVKMEFDASQVQFGLKSFPDHVHAELIAILSKTMNETVRDAKALVPVDTGTLKSEIKGFLYTDSMSAVISAHDNTEDQRLKAVVVERGRREGSEKGEMEPSWYLWDATKANRRRFEGRVTRMINKKVKELLE